ncbi:protein tolb [Anaeramoeba flamelloides]|uniref:Protein tolb n=1 Tax=Anaeramoeba flamelloides TaxID=1746091 RepID=A0ABQ8YK51_9EUKA|nr:protein tolb [Anaeramoeba flamelloides]
MLKLILLIILLFSVIACSEHSIFLDSYPGNLYLVELQHLDSPDEISILPSNEIYDITPTGFVEKCGNPDVLSNTDCEDGVTDIVFPSNKEGYWQIYHGKVDINSKTITNLSAIVSNPDERYEDPRISWNGTKLLFKCGTNDNLNLCVCDFPEGTNKRTIVDTSSELWGPAWSPTDQNLISYTDRTQGTQESDEVYVYDYSTSETTRLTDNDHPDMYTTILKDGRIIWAYYNSEISRDNLLVADINDLSSKIEINVTGSDDDAYAFKNRENWFAFVGITDSQYSLFLYDLNSENHYQITENLNVLGPVVFEISKEQEDQSNGSTKVSFSVLIFLTYALFYFITSS